MDVSVTLSGADTAATTNRRFFRAVSGRSGHSFWYRLFRPVRLPAAGSASPWLPGVRCRVPSGFQRRRGCRDREGVAGVVPVLDCGPDEQEHSSETSACAATPAPASDAGPTRSIPASRSSLRHRDARRAEQSASSNHWHPTRFCDRFRDVWRGLYRAIENWHRVLVAVPVSDAVCRREPGACRIPTDASGYS